jgi:hypothetical protein
VIGKHFVIYLKANMSQIKNGKHSCGTGIALAKSMNLPAKITQKNVSTKKFGTNLHEQSTKWLSHLLNLISLHKIKVFDVSPVAIGCQGNHGLAGWQQCLSYLNHKTGRVPCHLSLWRQG